MLIRQSNQLTTNITINPFINSFPNQSINQSSNQSNERIKHGPEIAAFSGYKRPVTGRFFAMVEIAATWCSSFPFLARIEDCIRNSEDVPRNRKWPTALRKLSSGIFDPVSPCMSNTVKAPWDSVSTAASSTGSPRALRRSRRRRLNSAALNMRSPSVS